MWYTRETKTLTTTAVMDVDGSFPPRQQPTLDDGDEACWQLSQVRKDQCLNKRYSFRRENEQAKFPTPCALLPTVLSSIMEENLLQGKVRRIINGLQQLFTN